MFPRSFTSSRTLLGLATLMLTAIQSYPVEIIAHRGASYDAPENSLSAMKLAWEQNADAIELDLWLTSDGKIAVFHDATTKRYDGQNHKVSELSLEDLRKLDIGKIKGGTYAGEKMPSLEDILATVPEKKRAVIEIKCGPEILPEFVRVIRASKTPPQQLSVISFNYDTIKESRKLLPELEHYFLMGYKKDPVTGKMPELEAVIEQAKQAQLTGLDLQFSWPFTPEFVGSIRKAGLKLIVWTIDDADVARKMVELGVDGITTNRPAWLRENLK